MWARRIAPGVMVAILLALVAKNLSDSIAQGVAGFPKVPLSPVLYAVLLGMLWRNTVGVPAWASEGLKWAMQRLLRTGIALVGLRLTLAGASAIALKALPVSITCLSVALVSGLLIARMLRVPQRLGILLAIGTAVCGCTAVVAMSPVIRAKHVETAFAVTCVVLFGCLAMLFYPWVAGYFFADSPVYAGVFLGTAIHDTSQVIGAALIYSQQANAPDALAAASVAKLLRNLSIVILVPAAAWLMRRVEAEENAAGTAKDSVDSGASAPAAHTSAVPFFVLAFVLFVILRTAGDAAFAGHPTQWQAATHAGQTASDLFLICGMTAVGLSVSFNDMWRIGWRPLAGGLLLGSLVGACSLSLTWCLHHFAM